MYPYWEFPEKAGVRPEILSLNPNDCTLFTDINEENEKESSIKKQPVLFG